MRATDTANGTFMDTCPTDLGKSGPQPDCLGDQWNYPTFQNVWLHGACLDTWTNVTDASGSHGSVAIGNCYTSGPDLWVPVYGQPGNYSATFTYSPTGAVPPTQIVFGDSWENPACGGGTNSPKITVVVDNSPDLGSSSPRSGCEGTCGSPINLTNGNTWIKEDDYTLPGLSARLSLSRTWNSLWPLNFPFQQVGMFGDSWQSNYEEFLQVLPNNLVRYWRGDGSAWQFSFDKKNGYTLTSPPDERATLTYNSHTRLSTLTFRDGSQEIFNSAGYLTAVLDPNGNQTTLTYNAASRVTQVTDAAGRTLTFSYGNPNFPNQVSSIQDSVGTIATYNYAAGGFLASVTYADNSAVHFIYDSNGLITSVTDANGKTLESHTYEPTRRGLTSVRANGVDQLTVSYNNGTSSTAPTATLTASNGSATTYGVQRLGVRNYVSSVSGSGCDSCVGRGNYSFTYDSLGNRLTSTDPLGHLTKFAYDANGNVTQVQIQSDSTGSNYQTWNYTYNSFGEVLTAQDPLGHTTTNAYDAKGNLLNTTTPSPGGSAAGSTTTFTYDTKGELLTITDPNLNKTTFAYWPAGLIKSITDAQNNITQFTYDARGNRTAVIDANNQTTSFTYDVMNRLTKITYPTTPATSSQFAYDYRGRRISATDPNGRIMQYAYDDADRLISVTDANSPAGVTQYGYDNENNLTSVTDAAGHQTTFHYDPFGHVTQTTFPSTLSESYAYDLDENLLTKTDRNNHTINYAYDFLNHLSKKTYPDNTTVNYTYDLANRLTQVTDSTGTYGFSYDNMGRLTGTTTQYSFLTGKTFSNAYAYDAASNRTSLTLPDGSNDAYQFDTLNRLAKITDSITGQFNFGYDALSRRTSLTRPNGVNTNYGYDSLSRLLSVLHKAGTNVLDGATYTYDNAGNRTAKTNQLNGITEQYTYDPLYQLTQVTQGTTTTESYTYDSVGNRLSSLGVSSYTYNSSNELTATSAASFTYDANGNILTKANASGTTQYGWDFENRLTSVTLPGSGGTVAFKYDPFGRRIQKSGPSGTTNFVYDGANAIEEVDSAGNLLARYAQGTGIDEPLSALRSGTTGFYEADGLGSITSLSSPTGTISNSYTYGTFGNITATSGSFVNPYLFTGRDYDAESGLRYYRARYYDPAIGRFISEDPMGFAAGVNFYAYVLNSPMNFRDPSGMDIAVIENGPTRGNPFGHTAIAITGEGVYSFGNGWFPGKSLEDYLLREAPRRDTVVYIIHTTPAQDAVALAYLKNKIGTPLRGVLKDNCSTRSNNALDAAGIPRLGPQIPGLGENLPIDLLDELGITPGSAGARAAAAGATPVPIPKGTTTIPGSLNQFEPRPYPY